MFQGQHAFHPEDAGQLRTELLRQEKELKREFARVEDEKRSRWNIVRVTVATYQAKHGDMVLAGFNQNTVVRLPSSSRDLAGLEVRVVQVGGIGAVTVAAGSAETVNGSATVLIGVATGFRDYVDDGDGKWWGPAV